MPAKICLLRSVFFIAVAVGTAGMATAFGATAQADETETVDCMRALLGKTPIEVNQLARAYSAQAKKRGFKLPGFSFIEVARRGMARWGGNQRSPQTISLLFRLLHAHIEKADRIGGLAGTGDFLFAAILWAQSREDLEGVIWALRENPERAQEIARQTIPIFREFCADLPMRSRGALTDEELAAQFGIRIAAPRYGLKFNGGEVVTENDGFFFAPAIKKHRTATLQIVKILSAGGEAFFGVGRSGVFAAIDPRRPPEFEPEPSLAADLLSVDTEGGIHVRSVIVGPEQLKEGLDRVTFSLNRLRKFHPDAVASLRSAQVIYSGALLRPGRFLHQGGFCHVRESRTGGAYEIAPELPGVPACHWKNFPLTFRVLEPTEN